MAQQKGSNAQILIGQQADISTVAAAGFRMPINTCNVLPSQNINSSATLTGSRNPVQPFRGNKDINGNIVVPVDSRAMWYWFQLMFGNPVTTGSASPWTHEFKVPDEQPFFTIEEGLVGLDTPQYLRYLGCKISSFAMQVGGDGELVATLGVMGADFDIATSSFDASPTDVRSTLDRVANFDAALLENSVAMANARSISLNIDMDLDGEQFVLGGGGVRGGIPEGIVKVSGQLVVLCDDDAITLINKGIDVTTTSLLLTMTDTSSSIVEFEIQEVEVAVAGVPIETPRGLVVTLDYQGFYQTGSESSVIAARLTNVDEHA